MVTEYYQTEDDGKEVLPGRLTREQIEEFQETINSLRGGLDDLELQLKEFRKTDQHGDDIVTYGVRGN